MAGWIMLVLVQVVVSLTWCILPGWRCFSGKIEFFVLRKLILF